jgi:hypothetical protein
VKKTLAAIGASTFGIAMVGAGAAAPAVAADVTTPCTDITEHVFATGELPDNFYLECVPQYGLGKAEFTIVPSETDPTATFPEDFLDLADEDVAKTTTVAPGFSEYFTGIPSPIFPSTILEEDDFHQTYGATIVAPITGVAGVTDATLPEAVAAACLVEPGLYGSAYVATFGPVDTTFTQTVDGKDWVYEVSATPKPTYFFATFDLVAGGVDDTEPWCVTDGDHTFAPLGGPPGPSNELFALVFHTLPDFEGSGIVDLGTFGPVEAVVPAAPVAPAALADTGMDVAPLAIAAGAFTMFGLALLGFTTFAGRRRRNA